jgi:hypothetical protein
MQNFITKVCSTVLLLALAPAVFAQTTKSTTTTVKTTTKTKDNSFFFKSDLPLDDKNNMQDGKIRYPIRYSAPAAIQVDNSWDVDVSAGYTYWYAGQDAMDIAFVAPSEVDQSAGFVARQSFGYKSGFKVGLGFDTKCDDWTIDADYTWYKYHKSDSFIGDRVEFTLSDWFSSDYAADTVDDTNDVVSSDWQLKMNMLDLTTGRPFYEGKRVVISPAAGLRVLWLHQNMAISGTGGALDYNYAGESRSWAVGPKGCVNTSWMLPGGFRVEGTVGSSVLYTRYTTLNATTSSLDGAGIIQSTSTATKLGAVRPTMDAGLGLGFGSYAFKNKYFFDVSARYDFMQFWSQNVLRNFASQLAGSNNEVGNLYIHGLTLNLRCDF